MSMQCPECKSTHINKNGNKKGKQNYICVDCQRQFLNCYQTHRGYSEEFKRECLKMYVNGMGLRAIGRVKGVSHVAIMNWVREVGELLPDAYEPETIPQVGELDELETFVGCKKSGATPRIFNALGNAHQDTKFGFGRQSITLSQEFWDGCWETIVPKHFNRCGR